VESIIETKMKFPVNFILLLMQDMQEDPTDTSDSAILDFKNLKDIIEIYSNCPLFMKGDSNNSDCFKGSLDLNRDVSSKYERVDKLLKYVHARIEEKFKGFRQAFRSFDKDFGGSLDYKEFILGLEGVGIRFKLEDCRIIFETLDYDGAGEIDFSKFCMLNTDRKIDWAALVSLTI
jgi:hypothetical protein